MPDGGHHPSGKWKPGKRLHQEEHPRLQRCWNPCGACRVCRGEESTVKATSPRLVVGAKGVTTLPQEGAMRTRAGGKVKRSVPDIPIRDDICQSDDKAARPRVTSRSRDRRPNTSPAGENFPNAGGSLGKRARIGRGTGSRGD